MGGLVRLHSLRCEDTGAARRDGDTGPRGGRQQRVRPPAYMHCYIPRDFTWRLSNSTHSSAPSVQAAPKLLPFDHVLPDPARLLSLPPKTAILYATLDSPNFRELHAYLYAAARAPAPHLTYVFRPIPPPPPPNEEAERAYLSGYGVALDLKKTDYLAVDDRLQSGGGVHHEEDAGSASAAQDEEDEDPIVSLLQQYPIDEIGRAHV